jgi:hypothetical protein
VQVMTHLMETYSRFNNFLCEKKPPIPGPGCRPGGDIFIIRTDNAFLRFRWSSVEIFRPFNMTNDDVRRRGAQPVKLV